jgi:hypothetical protein
MADIDLTQTIAQALGETTPQALTKIEQVIDALGVERAQALLAETEQVEQEGGQMRADGSGRRTRGGIFFRQARQLIRLERGDAPAPQPGKVAFEWSNRAAVIKEALASPGVALFARLTVVGRPESVQPQDDFFVATLRSETALPSLPRGVPHPENTETVYKVCISAPAWRRAAGALERRADDSLVAMGNAVPNTKQGFVVVLTNRATTKLLEASKSKRR